MINIKLFNKTPRWVRFLLGILVISLIIGSIALIFSSPSAKKVANSSGLVGDDISKSGKYSDAEGVLTYSYVGDYTKFSDSSLGFAPNYTARNCLGVEPNEFTSWATVMYDRGSNPYFSIGKVGENGFNTVGMILTPYSKEGSKIVFETDFSWSGLEENGCEIHFYSGEVSNYALALKFTNSLLAIDAFDNEYMNLIKLNNDGWYNLRVEIVPSANTEGSKYSIYLDNSLLYSYNGSMENFDFSDLNVRISVRGADCILNLDNTYFSKR